ncbi:MAG: glycosyltransferase family 4 protein [Actinomycetota bacterium]
MGNPENGIGYLIGRAISSLRDGGIGGLFDAMVRFFRNLPNRVTPIDEHQGFVAEVDLTSPTKLMPPRRDIDYDNLVLNWVIPDFNIGSGGHLNIFRTISYLESFGHTNRIFIYQPVNHFHGDKANASINKHFAKVSAEVAIGVDGMPDSDAVIATSWQTAYPVYKVANTRRKMYFIQDLETLFYPASAQERFAENTYMFGFDCITAGPWLAKIMREKYHERADYFDFAYNPDIYYPMNLPRQKKIVFYARQVTPRRGYELGVIALKLVKERHPEYEFDFVGWPHASKLTFPYRNLGILSQDKLAELYNEATLGFVISLTNPSLVNKEMMACGLPVVDIKVDSTDGFFGEGTILLAEPDPINLANAICSLIEDESRRDELAARALEYLVDYNWEKSAREVEAIIRRNLGDKNAVIPR